MLWRNPGTGDFKEMLKSTLFYGSVMSPGFWGDSIIQMKTIGNQLPGYLINNNVVSGGIS